jgi:hypothetical protein
MISDTWEVEYTDEFEAWWRSLSGDVQEAIGVAVRLLEKLGPFLTFPHSSDIRGSRHGRLRELRIQKSGRPIRMLYAFDPRRMAILLLGGDKTGGDRWYDTHVPIADRLYDDHLRALKREGDDGEEVP